MFNSLNKLFSQEFLSFNLKWKRSFLFFQEISNNWPRGWGIRTCPGLFVLWLMPPPLIFGPRGSLLFALCRQLCFQLMSGGRHVNDPRAQVLEKSLSGKTSAKHMTKKHSYRCRPSAYLLVKKYLAYCETSAVNSLRKYER